MRGSYPLIASLLVLFFILPTSILQCVFYWKKREKGTRTSAEKMPLPQGNGNVTNLGSNHSEEEIPSKTFSEKEKESDAEHNAKEPKPSKEPSMETTQSKQEGKELPPMKLIKTPKTPSAWRPSGKRAEKTVDTTQNTTYKTKSKTQSVQKPLVSPKRRDPSKRKDPSCNSQLPGSTQKSVMSMVKKEDKSLPLDKTMSVTRSGKKTREDKKTKEE